MVCRNGKLGEESVVKKIKQKTNEPFDWRGITPAAIAAQWKRFDAVDILAGRERSPAAT